MVLPLAEREISRSESRLSREERVELELGRIRMEKQQNARMKGIQRPAQPLSRLGLCSAHS